MTHRRLGIASIERLVGAGVFYGSVTGQARGLDGAAVVVVGAGNSGGQAALHLARHGADVTIVARDATLSTTMSAYLVDARSSPTDGSWCGPAPRSSTEEAPDVWSGSSWPIAAAGHEPDSMPRRCSC